MRTARNRRSELAASDPLVVTRESMGKLSSALASTEIERTVDTPRPSAFGLAGILAVGCLWLLLNVRHGYHLEDSVLYLPIAKQQLAPTLYPGNPLIEHLQRMPYPLYKSMGTLLATSLGANAHVLATVAMRLAFVVVLLLFMITLTGKRWVGLLAALAVILQPIFYGTLAWTELISPEFVQSDLGKMVLMGAVVAYLRGGPIAAALILGLGFNIHPIFSLATAMMLLPDALWRWRHFGSWRMIGAVIVGVLLATPTVVGIFRLLSLSVTSSGGDHIEMIRFFNYFHVFPSMFHRWEYVRFFGALGAGVVAFAVLTSRLGQRCGTLLRFAIGITLWCGFGAVFSEWLPRPLAMQMMPFRLTYAVRLLATGLVVAAAVDVMFRRQIWSFILASFWLATVMVSVKYAPWVTVAMAVWLNVDRRDGWAFVALVASMATAGLVAWIDPDQLPSLGNIPWAALLVLAGSMIVLRFERVGVLPVDESLSRESWPLGHGGRLGWVAVIVAAGMIGLVKTGDGTREFRLAAKPWLSPDGHRIAVDPWQAVMYWAKTHTEPHEDFITPPDLFGWTHYSERNTLASYHLGMQSVWDRRYAPRAKQRLADIGVFEHWAPGSAYHAFGPERLLGVAETYNISYVVWKRSESARMPWPVAYENDAYLVYDIRESAAEIKADHGAQSRRADRREIGGSNT